MRAAIGFAVLLLAAVSAGALDPDTALTQYGHTVWRVRDGYFSGPPMALAQTRDGFLWIGTQTGLVRFDGVRFTPWEPPAGSALPDDRIADLLEAGDGSLWIGTSGGVARWQDGKLETLASAGRFGALLEDRDGTVWVGHTRALNEVPPLCRYRHGEFRCFSFPDEPVLRFVGDLYEDRKGDLWITGDVGICRWRPERPEQPECFEIADLKDLVGKVTLSLMEDAEGNLLATATVAGRWRFAAGRWSRAAAESGEERGVEAIDNHGSLWIGTEGGGIVRRARGRIERFSRVDGLSGDTVIGLSEDREGNFWVATTAGLDRFRDLKVATLTATEGLGGGYAMAVTGAGDGGLWVAERRALFHLDPGAGARSPGRPVEGVPGSSLTSLLEDSRGRLWLGVDSGLAVRENGRFLPFALPAGAEGVVRAIVEDRDGDVWVATTNPGHPLLRIRGIRDAAVQAFSVEQTGGAVSALAADPDGGIWIGLGRPQVTRYRNGRFELWAGGEKPDGRRLYGLRPEARGLWLATSRGLGLLRRDRSGQPGGVAYLDTSNGLPCNDIEDVLPGNGPGDAGALWVKAACGLLAIPAAEIDAWIGHPGHRVRFRLLDAVDGVQSGLSPFMPRSARSRDGRLWFAIEQGGLQVLDPASWKPGRVPPAVQILRVVADRKAHGPGSDLILPPLTRDLEIDYTAPSLAAPEKLRFRYRLEGADGEWHDAGARREAFYTNLRPGTYRFRVAASQDGEAWSEESGTAFTIRPAFYQARWFLALCAAAAGGLAWAGYRWRVRSVTSRLDLQFQERLAERTRIAQELHDTLLQGFLSASMQLHVAADELPPEAALKPRLGRVLQLMSQVTEEGRNALRGLRSPDAEPFAADDLGEALARVRGELGLPEGPGSPEAPGFRVAVQGHLRPLHPIIRDEVYRIGREALVNAFRHAGARLVEAEIESSAAALRLRVRDDGSGIDSQVLRSGRDGHFGLAGMRERAEAMGARLKVRSRAGAGTEVELSVPARIAFQDEPPSLRPRRLARLFPTRETGRDE